MLPIQLGRQGFRRTFQRGRPDLTFDRAGVSLKLSQNYPGARFQRRLRIGRDSRLQASQTLLAEP